MKNVILLTIDTLRKDVFACYGGVTSYMPFLDSIQDDCTRFANAFSTGPYTQASFPGILTSSYYLEFGNPRKLSAKKTLVSEVLKKAGIVTAAFHSNPYLSNYFGYNRGWNVFYDSLEDEVTDLHPFARAETITKKSTFWAKRHMEYKQDKAFFLWVHYMDVHEPYIAEPDYLKKVDPSMHLTNKEMFDLFKNTVLQRDVSKPDQVQTLRNLYRAKALELDDQIQEFFQEIERVGALDNTIVIIASDHGDEFGEHGSLSHDGKMYSELVHVPLFIYERGSRVRRVIDEPVSNIDISPTVVHLLGLHPVESFRGISLLLLENWIQKGCYGEAMAKKGSKEEDTDAPTSFYLEGAYKMICWEGANRWELYDLSKDPSETQNVYHTAPIAQKLRNRIKARMIRGGK